MSAIRYFLYGFRIIRFATAKLCPRLRGQEDWQRESSRWRRKAGQIVSSLKFSVYVAISVALIVLPFVVCLILLIVNIYCILINRYKLDAQYLQGKRETQGKPKMAKAMPAGRWAAKVVPTSPTSWPWWNLDSRLSL